MNIACSMAERWPWGRFRLGFVMTHAAILVILTGALITDRLKVEGRLALWEGQESDTLVAWRGGGAESLPLPFSVRLDAFEIDYYPGGRRPAMFRSRVTVRDSATGKAMPAVIEMNRELSRAGFSLYQSSYQQAPDRDQSVFLVSRDPGRLIVFIGYALLLAGMTTVLATRIVQNRAVRRGPLRRLARAAMALAGAVLLGSAAAPAAGFEPEQMEALRRLAVQHDGRVMPLDTLAREATWKVTGRRRWKDRDPVELALGWSLEPQRWSAQPLVEIGDTALAAALGLQSGSRYAAFLDLVRNLQLRTLLLQAQEMEQRERPLSYLQRSARNLEERLTWLQGFLAGSRLRVIPDAEEPQAPWKPLKPLTADALLALARERASASPAVERNRIEREVAYNEWRPGRWSWWILSAAAAASLLAAWRRRRWLDAAAACGLLAGLAVMSVGLAQRWQIAGRIPASNMYESMLFLGWGIAAFGAVALIFLRQRLLLLNATAMSALTMALADLLPIDPFIHPMPPVLAGTAWLAIHVPIIMLSYSVLALGVLAAHAQIGIAIMAPRRRELIARVSDLLYWYIHAGSLLLIPGILTGSFWAASSWGRYWGWDPKEVWSLIAFLSYLGILHARSDRLISPFAVAALSIVAFWTILMTYVGVNYILAAGLHSYGFGGSRVVHWMSYVALAEAFFLIIGWLVHASPRWHEIPSDSGSATITAAMGKGVAP